jgi:replicative DNA helicase
LDTIRLNQEDRILRCLFYDTLIQTRASAYLEPILFDNIENRAIVTGIVQFMDKYKKFPKIADMSMGIPDDSPIKEKFNRIIDTNVDDDVTEDSQIDSIENFFKKQKTKRILEKHAEAIYNKNINEVLPIIYEDLAKAVTFSINSRSALSMLKDAKAILEVLNRPDSAIPSSLSQLRFYTGGEDDPSLGGYYRKTISAFMGMPNIGKTIFLCNEAAFAYRCGYNVMYITLEMHEELIYKRIMSNVSQIEQKLIKDQDADDLVTALKAHVLHNNVEHGDVYCKQLSANSSAADIENAIVECERVHDTKIDFLVVDYLGIMKPTSNNRNANTYQIGKEVTENLRDVAQDRNIAILTATQTNRSGYDDTNVTMANTSESSGINATLDLLITITQDEFLRRERIYSNTIIKNRYGPKDVTLFTKCDFLRMTLTDATDEELEKYYTTIASTDQVIEGFNDSASKSTKVSVKAPTIQPDKKKSDDKKVKITNNTDSNKPEPIIPPNYKIEKDVPKKDIINKQGINNSTPKVDVTVPNTGIPIVDDIF